jgi:hypothetical protein
MPLSKRRHEGYLLIDHRAGAGLGEGAGLGHGALFESATITCRHCQRVVVLNPDRTRARGYCPKCDHYICDGCEAVRVASGGACKTFEQVIEEAQAACAKTPKGL